MINIVCPSRYHIARKKIKTDVDAFFISHGLTAEQNLNLVFVGRNKMKAIASRYKKEPVALPVLSFPYAKNDGLVGEILICYPQAVLLAAERNKKVDAMLKELIEHGIKNLIQ
ncbi:hypothetical protein GYA28_00730 [Candidatus Roizmanbacteria bacterium]|jgi:ssRNA-specific RNase YbeY (16S rRNA maturation enzyme)|nr:hypothetical protein [Candidatus Roizmanbacteria bacterium]